MLKCSSCGHRNEGKNLLTLGRPRVHRDLQQDTLTPHCQPLNEVWEGVDPDFTPFWHSSVLDAPELPCCPCLSTRCPITGSSCDSALPLHLELNVKQRGYKDSAPQWRMDVLYIVCFCWEENFVYQTEQLTYRWFIAINLRVQIPGTIHLIRFLIIILKLV